MSQNLFQFIEVPRVDPQKKRIEERCLDFSEIYQPLQPMQLKMQSDRCLGCGNPYCEWRCPLHNYIPDWLQLAHEGRIIEAAELCHQTNSLPEICGRVCPQDRLCEGSCTLHTGYGAVTIGSIEKAIVDTAFESGWIPDLSQVPSTGKKVAIIGSGPAGLGCADLLIRNGVQPVVFDKNPEIGGLLTFGIPSFKLDKRILRRRRKIFEQMGITFQLDTEVGVTLPFSQLLDNYDAVFIGTGTYTPLSAAIDGEKADGIYTALDYLIANTDHTLGIQRPRYPYIDLNNKRVVVLGGGDTAMDCLRTAIRQGASEVLCAYRRDRQNMPGSAKEVQNAEEEGVIFHWNLQPLSFVVDDKGHVVGVRLATTRLGEPDEKGRKRAEIVPGSETTFTADAVLLAFGFRASAPKWLLDHGVLLDERGLVKTSGNDKLALQTDNPKIFSGGDMVRGSNLVVTAICDGRTAANSILRYLQLE